MNHSLCRLLPQYSFILIPIAIAPAQVPATNQEDAPKKANARPAEARAAPEPFDGASVAKMTGECVTLETEAGSIEIEMLPEVAPESVRNFLNLTATRA